MLAALERIKGLAVRIEDGLLVIMLSIMILLATLQILLRNLFDSGLFWADPALRMMVLWLALLGAIVATREERHIRIDLLSHYLNDRGKAIAQSVTDLFSALICSLISWHAGRLVFIEWQDGSRIFGGLPTWLGELIIPVGFGLMALRFLSSAPLRLRPDKPC